MIAPEYAVECLTLGFNRYIKQSKINATIENSNSSISIYLENHPSGSSKSMQARVSQHHPRLQNYVNGGEQPWGRDNISIEFIPKGSIDSKKEIRGRVSQNAKGSIKPFDITIYQYNSSIMVGSDLLEIFKAIIIFLNGGGYVDPFCGTAKQAKVIPRTANIKPYKGKSLTESKVLNESYLQSMAEYCMREIITENKTTKNMKETVKLNESQLRQVIKKSIKVLKEGKKSTFLYFVCDKYTNSCLGYVFMSKEDAQRYINELITKYPEWSDRYKVISLPREDFEVISNEDMKESKQTIKLNESQLRQMIKESIKKVLKENSLSGDKSYTLPQRIMDIYGFDKVNINAGLMIGLGQCEAYISYINGVPSIGRTSDATTPLDEELDFCHKLKLFADSELFRVVLKSLSSY